MLTALLDIKRTLIMGVLNVTPDSFSDGGDYFGLDKALGRAHDMVKEGADVIDVGGESSRPGSRPVSVDEEKRRVLPVLEKLVDELDVPLSVDTRRSQVAQMALDLGVRIVNDITALRDDLEMARVVARFDAHVVIMHMKGTPADMQHNPHYEDLMGELVDFFEDRVQVARRSGISDGNIILDPGIGFGKRVGDNFTILKNLGRIVDLGFPVMVGPSRKSFIGATMNLPVDERVEGTAAAVTAAILNGARMVRVHDVKAMKRVVNIADAIMTEEAQA